METYEDIVRMCRDAGYVDPAPEPVDDDHSDNVQPVESGEPS